MRKFVYETLQFVSREKSFSEANSHRIVIAEAACVLSFPVYDALSYEDLRLRLLPLLPLP